MRDPLVRNKQSMGINLFDHLIVIPQGKLWPRADDKGDASLISGNVNHPSL